MSEEALIRFSCKCGQRITAPLERAGKTGKCPRCKASIRVPKRRRPTKRINYARELNEAQFAAVRHRDGPALVIAGAGSGKTRTLVYRLAYLIESGVPAENILLVTFTKKAAGEMLNRVRSLLGLDRAGVTGGTFHHVANLILRKYAGRIKLTNDFSIMDAGDAADLIQGCRVELAVGKRKRRFPKKKTLAKMFSLSFNTQTPLEETVESRTPEFMGDFDDIRKLRELYIARKRANNLVDYDDLIGFMIQLLEEDDRTRKTLSRRFRHIMVDEYQDTNAVQDRMVALLASGHENLMVVGDDFQSIYSFRGADFKNIMSFPERYPAAKIYKLEHNYRSTPEIMDYTNAIIDGALVKFEKKLYSTKPAFAPPQLLRCEDSLVQARFVAAKILELYEGELELEEVGVLYRAHAHSIPVQVELEHANIPFRVRSGLKFYELAHIKDLFAVARVLTNPSDVLSWTRLLTLIPHIGAATAEKISGDILEAEEAPVVLRASKVSARAREHVEALAALLERGRSLEKEPSRLLETSHRDWYSPLMELKYDNWLERERDVESFIEIAARYGGVRELVDTFILEEDMVGVDPEAPDKVEGLVTLSSVHQAKGLEWRAVFVLEMLEGAFPSSWAVRNNEQMEEERRLFYVATTRAKLYLYIIAPEIHRSHFGAVLNERSRFISEIPEDLCDVEGFEAAPAEEMPAEWED